MAKSCYYEICKLTNIGDKIIANEDKSVKSAGKDKPLINEKIRAREVRLIDQDGNNHGIVSTAEALRRSELILFAVDL